jgi:hypothetical protein
VLLIAIELARGVSPSRRVAVVLTAVVGLAIVSNLGVLRDNARFLQGQAQLARANLGAVEMARRVVKPNLVLRNFPAFPFLVIRAGQYLDAARALGSPAATPAQIAAEPEAARRSADLTLIDIHQVGVQPSPGGLRVGTAPVVESAGGGTLTRRRACVLYRPAGTTSEGATSQLDLTLPVAGLRVTAHGGPTTVSVRRFGDEWEPAGKVAAGASGVLRIASDLAPQPWHVRVAPADRATVCGHA